MEKLKHVSRGSSPIHNRAGGGQFGLFLLVLFPWVYIVHNIDVIVDEQISDEENSTPDVSDSEEEKYDDLKLEDGVLTIGFVGQCSLA